MTFPHDAHSFVFYLRQMFGHFAVEFIQSASVWCWNCSLLIYKGLFCCIVFCFVPLFFTSVITWCADMQHLLIVWLVSPVPLPVCLNLVLLPFPCLTVFFPVWTSSLALPVSVISLSDCAVMHSGTESSSWSWSRILAVWSLLGV